MDKSKDKLAGWSVKDGMLFSSEGRYVTDPAVLCTADTSWVIGVDEYSRLRLVESCMRTIDDYHNLRIDRVPAGTAEEQLEYLKMRCSVSMVYSEHLICQISFRITTPMISWNALAT